MSKKRTFVTYFILSAAVILSAALSLFCGAAELSPKEIFFGIVGGEGYAAESVIMRSVRLPRLFASVLSGIGLSLSGVILQSVMGNELASPNTVGVSSGAGLFAVICLFFFPSAIAFLPFFAFFGAFLTCLIILAISRLAGGGRSTVILSGIALTSFFGAAISLLTILDTDILASYSAFSVGGFSGVEKDELLLPSLLIFSCLAAALCLSGRIEALSLGDGMAVSLGIKPASLRASALVLASMSAAAVISFAGLLGFVGLVVPHITRRIVGHSLKKQLTAAPLLGATVVTLSDLFGRVAFAPSELSCGIITAFVGAPFFFILLLKGGRRYDA